MSQLSREEWAKLLRRTCFGLGDTEPSGWCPITDEDHGYYLKMADAVLAKINDKPNSCGHPPVKQAARDTQFTSDVYCECGARRKRDWGGDWESPDAKA